MNDTQAIILLDLVRKAKLETDHSGCYLPGRVKEVLSQIELYIFEQWKLHRGETK